MNAYSRIEPPSVETIRIAHDRMFRDDPNLRYVLDVKAVTTYAEVLATSCDLLPPQHTLAHEIWSVASHIVTLAPGFDTTHDQRLNRLLGVLVLEEWLSELSACWYFTAIAREILELEVVLGLVPPAPDCASDLVMNWIKDWLLAALSDAECRSLGQVLGISGNVSAITAFVACAMSDDDADIDRLTEVSEMLARIMSAAGIMCHQPVVVHDPRVDRSLADHPNNRVLNEKQIAASDIVLIVAETPAIGLGVVDDFALKYGARIVVIVGDKRISPMLTGSAPTPVQIQDGPDLANEFKSYLRRHLVEIHRESILRVKSQEQAQIELSRYLDQLSSMNYEERTERLVIRMSRDRFRQLMSDADLFSGMSLREYWILQELLPSDDQTDRGLPEPQELPRLTLDQTRALLKAEEDYGWSAKDTKALEALGRQVLVAGGSQRLDALDPRWWERLRRQRGGQGPGGAR